MSGLTTRGRLASGERPLHHCLSGVTVRGSLTLAGQAVAGSPSMWREAWPEAPPVAGSGGSGWKPLREAGAWPEAPPCGGGVAGSPSMWRGAWLEAPPCGGGVTGSPFVWGGVAGSPSVEGAARVDGLRSPHVLITAVSECFPVGELPSQGPVFVTEPSSSIVPVGLGGQKVTLACEARGSPPPRYRYGGSLENSR